MRSLVALEDWATKGHAAQRAAMWLLFWPLLLSMQLPASFQRGSVSDWLRDRDLSHPRPGRLLRVAGLGRRASSSGCRIDPLRTPAAY